MYLSKCTGLIQPDGPFIRTFSIGETVVLRVYLSDHYFADHIDSLTWHHNGTEVTCERCLVSADTTRLTIANAISTDAGYYEVRISSLEIYGDRDSVCDAIWLPALENHAVHAPVTFILVHLGMRNYSVYQCLNTT